MVRRNLTLLGSACLLMLVFAGNRADAERVRFRFVGGPWSHERHVGWHRYWGGPSIGFYFAPEPVYIVDGYAAPSYYVGPDFWYSNPSFGLSLDFGGPSYGGGYYRVRDDGGRVDRYHRGDRGDWHPADREYRGGSFGHGDDRGRGASFEHGGDYGRSRSVDHRGDFGRGDDRGRGGHDGGEHRR